MLASKKMRPLNVMAQFWMNSLQRKKAMVPSELFKGHYIPVASWPLACQRQWHDAFSEPGLFEKDKPARHWRPATIKKTADGFGHTIDKIKLYKGIPTDTK